MEFPDTCWSVLAHATLKGGPEERAALEKFCRAYWNPVCACIRARGAPPDRVEDLTQDFFYRIIRRDWSPPISCRRFVTFRLIPRPARRAKCSLSTARREWRCGIR